MILGWPWWVAAALAAGLVVALHLWSSRAPAALVLPTAVPAIAWVVLHRGFLERLRSSY